MKKLTFILLILGSGLLTIAQDVETVEWSEDIELSWDHFKGQPLGEMPFNALTSARPVIEMKTKQAGPDVSMEFSIATHFFPNESWAQEKNGPEFLLTHEQIYFDIAELFSRKLRQRVQTYDFTSKFLDEYQFLYNEMISNKNNFQASFNFDTKYGGEIKEMKKWEKKILKELKDLSDYTETNFLVQFQVSE